MFGSSLRRKQNDPAGKKQLYTQDRSKEVGATQSLREELSIASKVAEEEQNTMPSSGKEKNKMLRSTVIEEKLCLTTTKGEEQQQIVLTLDKSPSFSFVDKSCDNEEKLSLMEQNYTLYKEDEHTTTQESTTEAQVQGYSRNLSAIRGYTEEVGFTIAPRDEVETIQSHPEEEKDKAKADLMQKMSFTIAPKDG